MNRLKELVGYGYGYGYVQMYEAKDRGFVIRR